MKSQHFRYDYIVQRVSEKKLCQVLFFEVTILLICIEISSYLTDKEQKISWHSFLRHAVHTYPVMSNDWINDKTGLNILQTTSIQLEIYTQLLIS